MSRNLYSAVRRQEWRRGTQKCVRYVRRRSLGPTNEQARAATFHKSKDALGSTWHANC